MANIWAVLPTQPQWPTKSKTDFQQHNFHSLQRITTYIFVFNWHYFSE